jgi:hypothetical protein
LLSFRGFDTPSLPAQGEQRRSTYFNIGRDIPGVSTVPAAVCQNGVMDRVLHPVEPLAFRLTVAGAF